MVETAVYPFKALANTDQRSMVFNDNGIAKMVLNAQEKGSKINALSSTDDIMVVYTNAEKRLTKEEGRLLHQIYEQYQELLRDDMMLDVDKERIAEHINKTFLKDFKYITKEGIPHQLTIQLFSEKLSKAESNYSHSKFDIDLSMKGDLLQENTNVDAIKYKPYITSDELDELIVKQFD